MSKVDKISPAAFTTTVASNADPKVQEEMGECLDVLGLFYQTFGQGAPEVIEAVGDNLNRYSALQNRARQFGISNHFHSTLDDTEECDYNMIGMAKLLTALARVGRKALGISNAHLASLEERFGRTNADREGLNDAEDDLVLG